MAEEDKQPTEKKSIKLDLGSFKSKFHGLKSKKLATIFGTLIIGIFIGAVIITLLNVGGSMSSEVAGKTASDYLTGNFLAAQGMSAETSKVTDEGSYYTVNVDILQGELKKDVATVYVSKDGKSMIIGQLFDLTQPISPITGSTTNQPTVEEYSAQDLEKITEFVECLKTKGVKIYGANWCGWTKKLVVDTLGGFDIAAPIYIECTEQEDICSEERVSGYPTIKINGELYEGQRTLEGLAEETGCEAPEVGVVVSTSSDGSC